MLIASASARRRASSATIDSNPRNWYRGGGIPNVDIGRDPDAVVVGSGRYRIKGHITGSATTRCHHPTCRATTYLEIGIASDRNIHIFISYIENLET